MSGKKRVMALALLLDSDPLFTLDEFLHFAQDLVDVEIKHGRLKEEQREMEVAVLMKFWHREPYDEPGEVISIKQSP
jgi:hypothetical protein